ALGRVGAGTAVKRIVGFAVACLPVKAGLLPILYDARRQGWHDRIARTLVVKDRCTTADTLPDRLPSPALPPAPLPDMRAPWRAAWFALPPAPLPDMRAPWRAAARGSWERRAIRTYSSGTTGISFTRCKRTILRSRRT
ncbi:MAG: hypothetical protein P4L33_10900, partial [Capsulimonadaceae bacterium]|nr:hypothetical protein [Capsulimonadaceae bacterium]